MPLGWYLAQGLYPLGPSSSDDEEGPCELPDGRIVCGPHGLAICGRCCTDYSDQRGTGYPGPLDDDSFEDDGSMSQDDDGEDSVPQTYPAENNNPLPTRPALLDIGKPRKGTTQALPARFFPPSATVTRLELFTGRKTFGSWTRFTHRNDPKKALIFTDGACLGNGQPNPKAGWAFYHGLVETNQPAISCARLEQKGPFADDGVQSSNRAELRAIIAALRFRFWKGEGFDSLVIATDSSYAVDGVTKWCKTWLKNGWQTSGKADVKNRDLWEALLGEVERAKQNELTLYFWHIPREWNTVADAAAKDAAAREDAPKEWTDVMGFAI